MINFLIGYFEQNKDKEAFILNDNISTYGDLLLDYNKAKNFICESNIITGSVIGIEGDFSSTTTAILLALIDNKNIIVPLTKSIAEKKDEFINIAKVNKIIIVNDDNSIHIENYYAKTENELYSNLRVNQSAGLVLFSSGSTGSSKASVHSLNLMFAKYRRGGASRRILTFLLFDHLGGFDVLFRNLFNCGTLIAIRDRTPENVLKTIERYKVEVLPTSPTFINLLLLSESYKEYDISSLELVTYGAEVMPEATLKRFNKIFPAIKIIQTYGLSELGVLNSKSKSSDSLWVKIGGEGFETRVVDNMLEIKSESAMLGYLNAPSPFTDDGYFRTMDIVEVDGEYYKILGRKSEIINVGGEKVYPAELESFFMEMDGVLDVAIKGEMHTIMGNIVTAKFKLSTDETYDDFKKRMRLFAKGRLSQYKIPQKIEIIKDAELYSERYKKMRK